ncbi:phage N-6-adenine-methyltransferase [Shewanella glacialipiscicola]|uniref:phage N-6-adenine-methyltransferase n=1 Tax=Shewanella glacialipiscicola TaxID=614069 RepID=UPI003D79AD5C
MSVNSQYASALRALKTKQAHLLEEVGDQWCTPEDLFWGINAVFGPFDIDLFTDGDNAHCARYYTAEDNALAQDWTAELNGGKGFANPPYSRPCKDEDGNDMTGMVTIMNKAKAERDKGAKMAFLIRGVPSETWWPEQADHICFIKGRVGFKLPDWFIPANDKQKASSAAFAGAVVIFDKEWRGGPISYIHRDSLRAQGKKLLDMIEVAAEKKAASYITGTIETRPDTAEQGTQIGEFEAEQIDIEEQIAKVPAEPANSVWPTEVLTLVEQAFSANPNTKTELRQQMLCERVNQRLLDNVLNHHIIAELNNMLARCEQVEDAA